MGLEKKIAICSFIGSPTWGALMWGASGLGWMPPKIASYGAAIGGGLGVAIVVVLGLHIGWVWLRAKGLKVGPLITIAFGLAIVAGGAIWGALNWSLPPAHAQDGTAGKNILSAKANPSVGMVIVGVPALQGPPDFAGLTPNEFARRRKLIFSLMPEFASQGDNYRYSPLTPQFQEWLNVKLKSMGEKWQITSRNRAALLQPGGVVQGGIYGGDVGVQLNHSSGNIFESPTIVGGQKGVETNNSDNNVFRVGPKKDQN